MEETKKLPFKVIRSEVSGGYIDQVHTDFTSSIDIVNYHKDIYAGDVPTIQSPFTEKWVGGATHRHVPLNTGNDDASNRQEAWHLDFNSTGVKVYPHTFRNSPPALWNRETLAKRPLNITNVKSEGGIIGNYSKNYEVVQTSGRRITNNLIVDGFEATGVLTTQFITGANDYGLPELNSVTGSKSIIVERFNAPGSKEESSRGALDREGEEMSSNASLPWRNYKIRKPFYSQLSQSTPQFGGTIHNVNRNTLVRGTQEYRDNGYVVHAIPRTDIQYSWITASSNTSAADLGWYQTFAGTYNRNNAFTDIDFITGSLTLNNGSEYFIDNNHIRSLIKDTKNVDLDSATFSVDSFTYSSSFSEVTNSPFTFTTWESIRNNESPIVRKQIKNNILRLKDWDFYKGEVYTNYTEPPVTFKYKPLKTEVRLYDTTESQAIDHTYTNNLSSFANKTIKRNFPELKEEKRQFYNFLYEKYTSIGQPGNPISALKGFSYNEHIWPKEENTGLSKTRKRKEYYTNKSGFTRDGYDIQLGTQRAFWRDSQADRERSRNSSGGYYSSINHLSTEETGSNYTIDGAVDILSYTGLEFTSSLTRGTYPIDEIQNFNSIAAMEEVPLSHRVQYSSDVQLLYTNITSSLSSNKMEVSAYYKRYLNPSVSGEFNEKFLDFYGFSGISGSFTNFVDLGSFYRNTSYKSVLEKAPYTLNLGSEKYVYDLFRPVKTESEEFRINPKVRYISFPGGVELNNQSLHLNFIFDNTSGYLEENWWTNLSSTDIVFSTMDQGLQRTTEEDSGKKPFFDSYEDYLQDIYPQTKEYSQIPEYRISENIQYYVENNNLYFQNNSPLTLDGANSSSYSTLSVRNNIREIDQTFMRSYATADVLKKHDTVAEQNARITELESVNIKVSGIKKLLPYNGFYPQDRTLQLANLYEDFVDKNIEGGYYSVRNDKIARVEEILDYDVVYSGLSPTLLGYINGLSSIYYNNKLFVATGINLEYTNFGGAILIHSSSNSDIWTTLQTQPIVDIRDTGLASYLGQNVKFISGSNGLNLFYTDVGTTTSTSGSVFQITSTDNGVTWSSPSIIMNASSNNTNFGISLDALYDSNNGYFVVAAGANEDSTYGSRAGQVYVVTSTDGTTWNSKVSVAAGGLASGYFGTSLSIYSGSLEGTSGYCLYISAPGDLSDYISPSIGGTISPFISTDVGATWSFAGSNVVVTNNNFPGLGGIKALEYNDRSYVFYSQPYEDTNGLTNNGAAYVAYSDVNNNWSTATSIKLAEGLISGDRYVSGDDPILAAEGQQYNIDAQIIENEIHYGLGCPQATVGGEAQAGKVFFGISPDGLNFQKGENMVTFSGNKAERTGNSLSIVQNLTSSYFVFHGQDLDLQIFSGSNQIVFELDIQSNEAQKAKEFAALEPIFAPGILYNTIKSGIAVDWPCATGSNTYHQTDDFSKIINLYYPQPKTMDSFTHTNTYLNAETLYSARGSIKSQIDYRIPFETILDPKEIFEAKSTPLFSNVTETFYSGLPITGSTITDLLDKCYIYGGYETYLDPSDIGDFLDTTPKKFAVPFVYRKPNVKDSGLFSMAVNNFLAETVNFFLEEGKMTTFESKPDNEWPEFSSSKTYYMDVILDKSDDLVMMEAWHSDKHPTGSYGEKMNGRYFGYPVNKTTKEIWTGDDFTSDEARLMHNDPAYAPYTPPYFEGKAVARLSFSPSTDGKYSATEILENMQVTDIFTEAARGWEDGSDAQINKMPVEASIDFRGLSKTITTAVETANSAILGGISTPDRTTLSELPENKKWVISSRMETPVLDFSNQESASWAGVASYPYIQKSGHGRGMWSGYGEIPKDGKGISLELSFPFLRQQKSPYADNTVESLLKAVGFEAKSKKIGQIRQAGKEIKEAVVLIPYLERPSRSEARKYTTQQKYLNNLYFMKIDEEQFANQKSRIENNQMATETKEQTSITRMIKAMNEYVIPPDFNFLKNENRKPFAMYFFEFTHNLSQQDLVDIWQGLMPDISYNAETEEVTISHESAEDELFHGKPIPSRLKWLVFRVKQKGIADFGKVTSTTRDDERFAQTTLIGRDPDPYSYNWPYDFFSLVEFGKVEIELKYKPRETVPTNIALQTNTNTTTAPIVLQADFTNFGLGNE